MVLKFFHSALTFLSDPGKRKSQTSLIQSNRDEVSTPDLSKMPTIVQELTIPKSPAANKDTGFPEPLSPYSNTTLTHPDADTSKNATLEGPDIALERRNSRSRFHRNSRTKSSGKIPLAERGLYDDITYADGTKANGTHSSLINSLSATSTTSTTSKSDEGEKDGDSGVFVNQDDRDEQGYKTGERKKGLLRKMNLHKV